MDLKGKAALVTGGASGIGAEAARRLTAAGARVAVADLDEARTRALADEIGGLALPGDAAQPDTMTMAVDIAEDTFGRLDVVLLNAGHHGGPVGRGEPRPRRLPQDHGRQRRPRRVRADGGGARAAAGGRRRDHRDGLAGRASPPCPATRSTR